VEGVGRAPHRPLPDIDRRRPAPRAPAVRRVLPGRTVRRRRRSGGGGGPV